MPCFLPLAKQPCHGNLPLQPCHALHSFSNRSLPCSLPPTNAIETKPPNRETKRRSEATEARQRTGRPTGNPAPTNSLRSPPKLPDRHLLSSRSPDSPNQAIPPCRSPETMCLALPLSPKGPEGHYHPFLQREGEGGEPRHPRCLSNRFPGSPAGIGPLELSSLTPEFPELVRPGKVGEPPPPSC